MVVIVIENAADSLCGELSKWFLEPKHGVFVGNISAAVRDELWKRILEEEKDTKAVLFFSNNSEQGFEVKMFGEPKRQVIDLEGVSLIKTL